MALFKKFFNKSKADQTARENEDAQADKPASGHPEKLDRKSPSQHVEESLDLFSNELGQAAKTNETQGDENRTDEAAKAEPPTPTNSEPTKPPMSQQSKAPKKTPAKASSKAKKPPKSAEGDYTAADIEILEGLEPVRRRPGMYIGGTDRKALHHLFAEVIDNSMDEAVAGFATWIDVELFADNTLKVSDNGRGIPVDPHPKFKDKSALEVILTTLHAGGKFDSKVYQTSGGLHGVGASVVNALSDMLEVEVARDKKLYKQVFSRGIPQGKLQKLGKVANRRGTSFRFHPDPDIFGADTLFRPARLMRMARSKAYLFGGVEIRWKCAPELISEKDNVPEEAVFHFPGGLKDFVTERIDGLVTVTNDIFAGKMEKEGGHGSVEWAITWIANADGFMNTYCNTVPTIEGGTHETGLRGALLPRACGPMAR